VAHPGPMSKMLNRLIAHSHERRLGFWYFIN